MRDGNAFEQTACALHGRCGSSDVVFKLGEEMFEGAQLGGWGDGRVRPGRGSSVGASSSFSWFSVAKSALALFFWHQYLGLQGPQRPSGHYLTLYTTILLITLIIPNVTLFTFLLRTTHSHILKRLATKDGQLTSSSSSLSCFSSSSSAAKDGRNSHPKPFTKPKVYSCAIQSVDPFLLSPRLCLPPPPP